MSEQDSQGRLCLSPNLSPSLHPQRPCRAYTSTFSCPEAGASSLGTSRPSQNSSLHAGAGFVSLRGGLPCPSVFCFQIPSMTPHVFQEGVKPLHNPTPTFVPASAVSPPLRSPNTSPSLPSLSRHAGHLAQAALLCSSHYFESLCRRPLLREVSPASPRFHLDSGNLSSLTCSALYIEVVVICSLVHLPSQARKEDSDLWTLSFGVQTA